MNPLPPCDHDECGITKCRLTDEYKNARYGYAAVMPDGRVESIPQSVLGNEIKDGKIASVEPLEFL